MKKKILIVSAEYYPEISEPLKISAIDNLKNFDVKVLVAPGVFEIPFIISNNIKKYHAFLALGCVIKGETPHFELISSAVMNGIIKLSIESKKPIGNAILTCLNKDQALARSKKGKEAAEALKAVLKNANNK
tara:strand:- start:899 stop:1294 length:396 start_codon:yes stop_codon:yes gene_type:complete